MLQAHKNVKGVSEKSILNEKKSDLLETFIRDRRRENQRGTDQDVLLNMPILRV